MDGVNTDGKQTREYYISKCRYYNGSDDIYSSANIMAADYERVWVGFHFDEEGVSQLRAMLDTYIKWGLEHFNEDDGTPMSLKALLLGRFLHWGFGYETADDFKKWYKDFYILNNRK